MQQLRQWFVAAGLLVVLGVVGSIILVAVSPDPTPPVFATLAPGSGGSGDLNAQPLDIQNPPQGGDVPLPAATIAPAPTAAPPQHTVVSGDTLFAIAQQYGTTVEALVAANSLSDPNRLEVGQVLIIPEQ